METTTITEKYCPICGKPGRAELNRFGEWACSEEHAEQFAREHRERAARQPTTSMPEPPPPPPEESYRRPWYRRRRGGC
jgi:hypothetical protein